jgi:hypothetical protein
MREWAAGSARRPLARSAGSPRSLPLSLAKAPAFAGGQAIAADDDRQTKTPIYPNELAAHCKAKTGIFLLFFLNYCYPGGFSATGRQARPQKARARKKLFEKLNRVASNLGLAVVEDPARAKPEAALEAPPPPQAGEPKPLPAGDKEKIPWGVGASG